MFLLSFLRCPGGATKPVTWENRLLFADLLLQYRLNEGSSFVLPTLFVVCFYPDLNLSGAAQVAAIREGFGEVIPLFSLSIFSWSDLSPCTGRLSLTSHCCADTQSNKTYSPSSRVIQDLWKVVNFVVSAVTFDFLLLFLPSLILVVWCGRFWKNGIEELRAKFLEFVYMLTIYP